MVYESYGRVQDYDQEDLLVRVGSGGGQYWKQKDNGSQKIRICIFANN